MKDENKQVLSVLERVQRVSRVAIAMLCLFVSFALYAQETVVKGTVVDSQGEPLIGATIMVAKTTNGTTADFDGNFTLKCKPGAKLVISYVGYESQELPAKDGMKVVLKESSAMLDAVEVVAYGVQKKVTVTGAISSVKGDDLARTPVANVSDVLAGQLTGVTTVSYSGEPGDKDATSVFVRGQGTWNNSKPLIQVDGVEREMFDIDPEEIESITVLKDASATAVFGVRGANGVVLITTKRGKEGKAKIDVSTSFSLVKPTKMVEQASSWEYGTFHNQMQYNDWVTGSQAEAFSPQFSDEVLNLFQTGADPIRFPSIRWADYLLRQNTMQTKSNVNISGGTKGVRYFVSLGFLTQDGMFKEFGYKENFDYSYNRFNYRTNLDLEVTKTSTISFNVSGIVSNDHKPYTGQGASRMILEMYQSTPFSSPGIVDDRMIFTTDMQYIDGLSLPFVGGSGMGYITGTSGTGGSRGVNTNKLQADLMWKQKLDFVTPGLDFHIKGSYNSAFWARQDVTVTRATYNPILLEDGTLGYRKNSIDGIRKYSQDTGKERDWYFEAAFNYARTFGENNITGLLLYNQSKKYYPSGGYGDIPSGYVGLVGRVTYDYASKYLIDFNIGYNGSENFHPDRRFGVFPAGSIGWVVSNEKFWEPVIPYMDFFKLRASWGLVGNDKVGGNRFMYTSDPYVTGDAILAQYNDRTYGYNFGLDNSYVTPGYAESSKNNPDVTWEKAFKQDYGFDMQLFNSRLKLAFDYYREHRTGILLQDGTAPNYVGFAPPYANLGVVDSHGWEVSVNWNQRVNDKFSYWANLNLSNNWNKVIEKKEAPQANYFMYQAGHRINSRLMYKFFQFYDPATTPAAYEKKYGKPFPEQLIQLNAGDACYVDLDGDGKITPNDKTRDLGYTDDPQWVAGLNLGATYRDFELSMQWTGAWGVTRMIGDVFRMPFYSPNSQTQGGLLSYHLSHSWNADNPGQDYDYPRPSWNAWDNNYAESTLYEKDSKYLRMKTIQLAYNLRAPWLGKVGMKSLQVALSAYNLLTFTNYIWGDPEARASSSPSYPLQKTYTVSLKLNF